MGVVRATLAAVAACSGLLLGAGAAGAAGAPAGALTCSGGVIPPGTYQSLTVTGSCAIPSGAVSVLGNLTVAPGAALDAGSPTATVTVGGNIVVGKGAALNLGCAVDSGCPTPTNDRVSGNVTASQPLALLLHGNTIQGNVTLQGGGAGVNCAPNPVLMGAPVFSTIEDNAIGGSVSVNGYQACWFGIFRNHVGGSVTIANNTFADEDATEVATNTIGGSLACVGNSPAAQIGDSGGSPNTVAGVKTGQCASL